MESMGDAPPFLFLILVIYAISLFAFLLFCFNLAKALSFYWDFFSFLKNQFWFLDFCFFVFFFNFINFFCLLFGLLFCFVK